MDTKIETRAKVTAEDMLQYTWIYNLMPSHKQIGGVMGTKVTKVPERESLYDVEVTATVDGQHKSFNCRVQVPERGAARGKTCTFL